MKNRLITILLLSSITGIAQIPVKNFSTKEKLYLQTLQQAASYLKSKPTKYFDFHSTPMYSNDEAFYDTIISRFFNKEKMLKIFEENTNVFAPEGKLDLVRHTLNSCDYYLDIVPVDSIFIRPMRSRIKGFSSKEDSIETSIVLEIFFKVDGNEIIMLGCTFDSETNKLLGFNIMSASDMEESKQVLNFLRRQKNYYEYPVKRNFN